MKKFTVVACIAVICVLGATSCVSAPTLQGSERFAVVNISLEREFTVVGDNRDDIFMLTAKTMDDPKYDYHREAFAIIAELLAENYTAIFAGLNTLPLSAPAENTEYLALAQEKAGTTTLMSTSANDLYFFAESLPYIDIKLKANSIPAAAALGADVLVSLEFKGEFEMAGGLQIAGTGMGPARLRLKAVLTATAANGKIVKQKSFDIPSEETVQASVPMIRPVDYPRLTEECMVALIPQLVEEVQSWRN